MDHMAFGFSIMLASCFGMISISAEPMIPMDRKAMRETR